MKPRKIGEDADGAMFAEYGYLWASPIATTNAMTFEVGMEM